MGEKGLCTHSGELLYPPVVLRIRNYRQSLQHVAKWHSVLMLLNGGIAAPSSSFALRKSLICCEPSLLISPNSRIKSRIFLDFHNL